MIFRNNFYFLSNMYPCLIEYLAEKLIKVEGPIQEENSWHDTFWGICNGWEKTISEKF